MKKLTLLLLLCCVSGMAQYREWHVVASSTGDNYTYTTGDGTTRETAWSLKQAFDNTGPVIHEGDTVWLHGGDYKGHFTCPLSGTAAHPITVASYPGEWARLDGNIYTYVNSSGYLASRSNGTNIPADDEMDTYTDDDVEPGILTVTGSNLIYKDFEITCLGNINRLFVSTTGIDNCDSANGFHKMSGIDHSATNTTNKFVNLIIRNIPGSGVGSWKYTQDSEIYGCMIYNNGYVLNAKLNCSSSDFSVLGKGFGIYTQNIESTQNYYRAIKNNIFMNNYDSGIAIWSATGSQTLNLLENYNISQNIFLNNGGPVRDVTANLKIISDSGTSYGHPHNINVTGNIFYVNSKSSYTSGLFVGNTNGVTISNNHIFKGTAGATFQSNNSNLTFDHNFYWGKYIQYYISPTGYSSQNWNFNNNKYHKWNFETRTLCQILNPSYNPSLPISPTNPDYLRIDLENFQSPTSTTNGYNGEASSIGPTAANHPQYLIYGDATSLPELLHFAWGATGAHVFNSKSFITQNKYDPNVFYVTVFDPWCQFTGTSATINADFSAFVSNDPSLAGKYYEIKDVQDYVPTQTPITGTLTSATAYKIAFPMTLTNFETLSGVSAIDYTTPTEHTKKDLSVFVVRFGCQGLAFDRIINRTDNTTVTPDRAKNNIFIGTTTGYTANSGAVVDVRAGDDILLRQNVYIRTGSDFLAKIENLCPNIALLNDDIHNTTTRLTQSEPKEPKIEVETLVVYPNPTPGIFKIESLTDITITRVVVSDIHSNRKITDIQCKYVKTVEISIPNESQGIYTAQVFLSNGTIQTKKIIKE
jgi:hypothetical protein